MLYNAVLVSAVQQSESDVEIYRDIDICICICIYTYMPLFLDFLPCKSPQSTEFPELQSRFPLTIFFIHSINCIFVSISIFHLLSSLLSPTGVHTFVFHACVFIPVLQIIHDL